MKTSQDIAAKLAEEKAELDREVVSTERGIEFRLSKHDPSFMTYGPIDWDRIRDERDVISWLYHLSGKDWLTPSRLRRFLEVVAEKKKLDLHCAA